MDNNDDSRFVRLSYGQTENTVFAPCGTLVEIYPSEGRDGTYATPLHFFFCQCGEWHTIVSVIPPSVA